MLLITFDTVYFWGIMQHIIRKLLKSTFEVDRYLLYEKDSVLIAQSSRNIT